MTPAVNESGDLRSRGSLLSHLPHLCQVFGSRFILVIRLITGDPVLRFYLGLEYEFLSVRLFLSVISTALFSSLVLRPALFFSTSEIKSPLILASLSDVLSYVSSL